MRWQPLALVGQAVLFVLIIAYFNQDTTEPVELLWTALGAGASAFSWIVVQRRWNVNAWRQHEGINGQFAISTTGSVVLRISGMISSLLIVASGISSMLTPASIRPELKLNDLIVSLCLLGLGCSVTFSAWFANRQADRAADYQRAHPDGETPASAVAKADHLAVSAAIVAADAGDVAAQAVSTARQLHDQEGQDAS